MATRDIVARSAILFNWTFLDWLLWAWCFTDYRDKGERRYSKWQNYHQRTIAHAVESVWIENWRIIFEMNTIIRMLPKRPLSCQSTQQWRADSIHKPLKLDDKVILVTTLYRKRIGFYFNGKSLSEDAIHNSPPDEIYGPDQFELVPRLSIVRSHKRIAINPANRCNVGNWKGSELWQWI